MPGTNHIVAVSAMVGHTLTADPVDLHSPIKFHPAKKAADAASRTPKTKTSATQAALPAPANPTSPASRAVIQGRVLPGGIAPRNALAARRRPRALGPAGTVPQTRVNGALPMGEARIFPMPAAGRFTGGDHPTRSTVYDTPSSRPRQPDLMAAPLHPDERGEASSHAYRLDTLNPMQFEPGRHGPRLVPEYWQRAGDPTRL